jgi:hypothetical protein
VTGIEPALSQACEQLEHGAKEGDLDSASLGSRMQRYSVQRLGRHTGQQGPDLGSVLVSLKFASVR